MNEKRPEDLRPMMLSDLLELIRLEATRGQVRTALAGIVFAVTIVLTILAVTR